MNTVISCLLSCLLLFVPAIAAAGFSYSYSDQSAWPEISGSECGYTMQSPVNINNTYDGDDIGLSGLVFSYLEDEMEGTWTNNGHSVQFTPSSGSDTRTVQTYRGTYELLQFHFHWGANDNQGSEHTVNGDQYSGELHFVHKTTSTDASDTDFDYYTVVGVLLQADDSLSAADTVWETFSNIPDYSEELSITVSNVTSTFGTLLPSDREYYHYNGSLTTPLCNQIVQWVLLQNPLSVPSSFFTAVRTLQTENDEALTMNFRDIQSLNGRKVYRSASNIVLPTITLLVMSAFAALIHLF